MTADQGAARRRFEPEVTEHTQPFWDATRDRRLVIQWCPGCNAPVWYPRETCPGCLGSEYEWRESTGSGTVDAVTVMHRPGSPGMAEMVPYTVAMIELAEGVRMMSNVVGCEPYEVAPGMAVRLTWETLSDGRNLPLFEPARP
ncbi:MAG: OB-fold domain-containing protein [Acidimicrobiia bacterium]|nr:OB-fold domain-containing protein [Acidimicrobiia bacterium]